MLKMKRSMSDVLSYARNIHIIFIFVLLIVYPLSAETLMLKSGQKIEGKIIEKTDKYVKIDFEGVSLTFYNDEIADTDETSKTQVTTAASKVYADSRKSFCAVPPEGWFVVSGEDKIKEAKEKLERELTPEKVAEKMRSSPGKGVCPLTQNPDAMKKILTDSKRDILKLLPQVTFYQSDPKSATKGVLVNQILIGVNEVGEKDNLEECKFRYELLKRMLPNVRFIEEPHIIKINGVDGLRAVYTTADQSGNADVTFYKNNKEYSVSLMGSISSLNELLPVFNEVVDSFTAN
jgi:hypothetical protein